MLTTLQAINSIHKASGAKVITPMIRLYTADNPTVTGTYTTGTYTNAGQSFRWYKFTTNGTFTPSQDCSIGYIVIGGVGNSAGTDTGSSGYGSSANGCNIAYCNVNDNLTTYCPAGSALTITIGAGGRNWQQTGSINGENGSNSTITGTGFISNNQVIGRGSQGGLGSRTKIGQLTTPANTPNGNIAPCQEAVGGLAGKGGNDSTQNTDGSVGTAFTVDFLAGSNIWNSSGGGSYYNSYDGKPASYTSPYYGAKSTSSAVTNVVNATHFGCSSGSSAGMASGVSPTGLSGCVYIAYRYA